MAKNPLFDKKGIEGWHIGIAILIVIAIFWMAKEAGGGCATDADCAKGQICTVENICETKINEWDNWMGPKPDKRCPDNTEPKGLKDPDCPLFCPIGSPLARAGAAGFCCFDNGITKAVDCSTLKPFFATETNSAGETINILPNYPILQVQSFFSPQALYDWGETGKTPVVTSAFSESPVTNSVTWTAPTSLPSNVASLILWMEFISIESVNGGIVTEFVDNWGTGTDNNANFLWGTTPSKSTVGSTTTIGGTPTEITGISSGSNGRWDSHTFLLNNMGLGTTASPMQYNIVYKYCFKMKDSSGNQVGTTRCNENMKYTLKLTQDTIDFNAQVTLG